MSEEVRDIPRPWLPPPPGRLIGRGHPAGEFLEAYDWDVLEESLGHFKIAAHLPQRLRNPRGQLFGGFTPAYIDLLAVRTVHPLIPPPMRGVTTLNMRVDYLEPVEDERFVLDSRVIHSRGKTHLVEVLFRSLSDALLVFSVTTIRQR